MCEGDRKSTYGKQVSLPPSTNCVPLAKFHKDESPSGEEAAGRSSICTVCVDVQYIHHVIYEPCDPFLPFYRHIQYDISQRNMSSLSLAII